MAKARGRRKLFTPDQLAAQAQGTAGFSVLSGDYFRVANTLREVMNASEQASIYVFQSITMFVSAFKGYLQVHLKFARRKVGLAGDAETVDLFVELKAQIGPYQKFAGSGRLLLQSVDAV